MKTINVRDLQKQVRHCLTVSQKEQVIVTRHGKPVAVVTGVEKYDWEDLLLATSPSFWRMIEERRKEQGIPLAEARRRLGLPASAHRPKRARKPRTG